MFIHLSTFVASQTPRAAYGAPVPVKAVQCVDGVRGAGSRWRSVGSRKDKCELKEVSCE